MGRWGTAHADALKKLFSREEIDVKRQDNQYIDSVFDSLADNVLSDLAKDRFRYHWKEKSQQLMVDKALQGKRRSEFCLRWLL